MTLKTKSVHKIISFLGIKCIQTVHFFSFWLTLEELCKKIITDVYLIYTALGDWHSKVCEIQHQVR